MSAERSVMSIIFKNAKLVMTTGIYDGELMVENGIISNIVLNGLIRSEAEQVIDVGGRYLSPGFIDIHTHGGGGFNFINGDTESIYGACKTHLVHGTTSVLPTAAVSTQESIIEIVDLVNGLDLEIAGYPNILGLHLEGPYTALEHRESQNTPSLRCPDPLEYLAVLERTDRIKRWSFAAELPGSDDFLRVLKDRGVVSSLVHSEADFGQVVHAYEKGLTVLSHFYYEMSTVNYKDSFCTAGAVEAGYLLEDMYVEVVADGCSLPKELLQLIYKVKRNDRICLVSNGMRTEGKAKPLDNSASAENTVTSNQLVRIFRDMTAAPLFQVVKMASLTPARLLGIGSRKGSIGTGKDADLIIFDEDIHISLVMVKGEIVF